MTSAIDPSELDSFLSKVDEIENVIKSLNSNDDKIVSENLNKADKLIEKFSNDPDSIQTKIGKSRTVINKSESNAATQPLGPASTVGNDQDAFMKALEFDANERHKRKQENLKISNELKEKGNVEYQNKNFEKAVQFYSEALQNARDNLAVYTNRAQAYIKLEKYLEAIEDCDWALRINEKCVKAMIHKGKALTFLKEFDKAKNEFENARLADSKQSTLIDDYLKELERARQADSQEKSAKLFLDSMTQQNTNSPTFINVLNMILNVKDQSDLYYSGGFRYLSSLLDNENKKTLFRTQNGFKVFDDDQRLARHLKTRPISCFNSNQIEFVSSALDLLQVVITECDENIRILFETANLKNWLNSATPDMIRLPTNEQWNGLIRSHLNILYRLVKNEFGLEQLISNLDSVILANDLVQLALSIKNLAIKEKAVLIVQNLALEKKFHLVLKEDKLTSILKSLCDLIKSNNSNKSSAVVSESALTIIYAFTSSKHLRDRIVENDLVWEQTLELFKKNNFSNEETILNLILSFLINLTASKSAPIEQHKITIVECVLKIQNSLKNSQIISLFGNLIQNISERNKVLGILFEHKSTEELIKNIKDNACVSPSIKLLAICAQNDTRFCNQILDLDKNASFLHAIFQDISQKPIKETESSTNINLKKMNESVINNSVLCLTCCVEKSPSLGANLTETNIIMDLLYLARDGLNLDLRKNCGILIAKLVKKDNKHLERLRELHGIEILHASLKNADI